MKNSLILVLIATLSFSCKKEAKVETQSYKQIEKAHWLLGEWKNTTKEFDFTEKWMKQNDSSFTGKSYVLVGKDTVFNENVVLIQKNDSLFYDVSVKDQNEAESTAFYLTKFSDKELVFENPTHDYPNKLVYTQFSKDSIVAKISGIQNGKEKKEIFPMKRK